MPKDKVGKESVSKTPRLPFAAFTAAADQIGVGAKGEKRAQKERDRQQALADRKQSLSETAAGRRTLKKEAKAEKDKQAKIERREAADQLGLGRNAQREPKGANKDKMQKENTQALMDRLNNTPKGPQSRNAARKILKTIENGPVTKTDANGKPVRNSGAADTYFGAGKAEVVARLNELAGKTYSGGNKAKKGVFRDKADAPNTVRFGGARAGRDYVKARSNVDVTKSKRSKFTQVKKNPVGRPKGTKNKPK